MEKTIMTPDEAAARWHMSAGHIRLLCREGKLKAFKFGAAWRIPAEPNEQLYEPREVER